MLLQVFADNLRQMRTEKGIKQVDFATRVGCKQTMVSRWEKGKALPKEDQIEKMASVLECDPLDFFRPPGNVIVVPLERWQRLVQLDNAVQKAIEARPDTSKNLTIRDFLAIQEQVA